MKKNALSTRILNQVVNKKKIKADVGEEMYSIAIRMQHMLLESEKYAKKKL